MGDPLRYPEIHSQRFLYAMKHLPSSVRDDYMNSVAPWCMDNGFATT